MNAYRIQHPKEEVVVPTHKAQSNMGDMEDAYLSDLLSYSLERLNKVRGWAVQAESSCDP